MECQSPGCKFFALYVVAAKIGPGGKPRGQYGCCGRHLAGIVQFVTVPGGYVEVQWLE